MEKILKQKGSISYDAKRLIKIFEVGKETKVFYIVKTLLEIINRWKEVEIHVIQRYDK